MAPPREVAALDVHEQDEKEGRDERAELEEPLLDNNTEPPNTA